ncbi:hypothetical protein EBR16_05925 [bacterium]|jgi:hypothetical protein|nr:hypothetical protein [bacterium]
MFRRLANLLRRKEYREGAYAHPDLSGETGLAWHVRLRLMLTGRGGVDPTDDKPGFWIEHRRWLLLAGALVLAWLIVESALAWNFLDG